jgi:hypothetical protein
MLIARRAGPRFATKTAQGTKASSFSPPASPASRGRARGRARGGRLWPRLKVRTLDCDFGFPAKMVTTWRKWPSGPHSRILRIGSPRSATITTQRTKSSGDAPRGQDHRCSSLPRFATITAPNSKPSGDAPRGQAGDKLSRQPLGNP